VLNDAWICSGFEDIFSSNSDVTTSLDGVIEDDAVLNNSRFALGEVTPSPEEGGKGTAIADAGREEEDEDYGGEDGD
jgi:hypothetical protein